MGRWGVIRGSTPAAGIHAGGWARPADTVTTGAMGAGLDSGSGEGQGGRGTRNGGGGGKKAGCRQRWVVGR